MGIRRRRIIHYTIKTHHHTTKRRTQKKEVAVYKGTKNIVQEFKEQLGTDQTFTLRGKYIPLFLMTDWLKFYDREFKEKKATIYPVLSTKKDGTFVHRLNLNKYLDVSREGIQRYIENPNFKEETIARYEQIKQTIHEFYEQKILSDETEEEQLLHTLKIAEEYLHEVVALTLFIDFLDSKTLEETYNKNRKEVDFEKIYETSEINDFASFDLLSNEEIINWLDKNKKYLTHIYTGYSAAPTPEEVEEKISKLDIEEIQKEVDEAKQIIKENKQRKQELYEKLGIEEQLVVDFLVWISAIRDDRKHLMNKMDALMIQSIRTLYKLWDIEIKHAENSYSFEVLKGKTFIENKLDDIKKREGDFVNIYYGGENYQEVYNDADLLAEAEQLEKPRENTKKLKGQTANKGYVRGFVKIILDPKQNHSFMHGEILVTGMTRPEFVPLMKKASAVITNEGGIACHAAIVSRELNKPCIIGTKNATEVLKDGDYVEIDANNGIVKILEKSKLK